MIKVISDVDKLHGLLGWHPIESLLAPGIRLDGPKMVTPVLAETDQGQRLLAREQESGNLLALGVALKQVTLFETYVTFEPPAPGRTVHADLGAALASLAGGKAVTIEPDMPYGRYLLLKERVEARVARASGAERTLNAYRIPGDQVRERFAGYRKLGRAAARRVIERRPQLAPIASLLDDDRDNRFELLHEMLEGHGLEALLSVAPIDIRELTGLAPGDGWAALAARGEDGVYVLSPDGAPPGAALTGSFKSLSEAVTALAPGARVGVGEKYLPVGLAEDLLGAGISIQPFANQVSKWREYRDAPDLCFTAIAAEASRRSIESALDEACHAVREGREVTEKQVFERYLEAVREFNREVGDQFEITHFFVNCHAADRTIYPAQPVDWPVTTNSRSLKFDAGLKLSIDKVVLGTSDMARTLTLTPAADEIYGTFREIVQGQIKASVKVGQGFEEVHRLCVEELLRRRERYIEIGLLPAGADVAALYGRRNVGHLMGKQESFVTEFRPRNEDTLQAGAIGAYEIQWPYAGHSIAYEDMWVVGPDGTHLLTAS